MLPHEAAAVQDLIGLLRMLQPQQGCNANAAAPPGTGPVAHSGVLGGQRSPLLPPCHVPVLPGSPLPSGLGDKSAAPSRPAATAAAPAAAFCLFFMASMAFSLRACLWPL